MERTSTHTYAAPVETVFAVMTDPDALRAKYTSLGHRDVKILTREVRADGAVTVHSQRTVPMEVPGFAKRVLSPTNKVVQEDRWGPPEPATGARVGRWSVDARGVPVTVGGTIRIDPAGDGGSVVTIRADISCGLPLVGGKIAGFVADDVLRTIRGEETFTARHLATAAD